MIKSIHCTLRGCLLRKCRYILVAVTLGWGSVSCAFTVDSSPVPKSNHPIAPVDQAEVSINPPSMVWRSDDSAISYVVELSRDAQFPGNDSLIRVDGLTFPFYNHYQSLAQGLWFWRYFVVRENGEMSESGPIRSFVVSQRAQKFPVPSMAEIFALMPKHPRIYVTPDTLEVFQKKRFKGGQQAWNALKVEADRALRGSVAIRGKRIPLKESVIKHSEDSLSHSWKKGDPIRRQVFLEDPDGELFWLPSNTISYFNSASGRLNTLSLAWQISGDPRYLAASRKLIALIAPLRLDAHLSDDERAEHDTVVYAYEQGLKSVALAYDRLYDQLSEDERAAVLAHVEFHVEAAGNWLKKSQIHLAYLRSHQQQCMHNLLVTVLATAKDSAKIDRWVSYIVPQYMNRIAWTSEDGGYFEGQTYGHKFAWILEGLAALRSATGVDLFKKPEISNAGEYWLYAMNLNYWFQHWGDNYSLVWTSANSKDAYISAFLAAMNNDPYVKWYSETVLTDPEVIPFDYISADELKARPPVDIPQARAFESTGVVVAYDGLYDHSSDRIFFRSSPWGSHSHSHADQNGFVIHSGGEILAPDTGYYTYSGDSYHKKWSRSTFAHNSMLVNGQPQSQGIEAKGNIDEFFHNARMTYFVGDASQAYAKPLKTFRRAVLFIRPSTYIIYDELAASAPSVYGWLLNVFQEPEIHEDGNRMTIEQADVRMSVETLLPEEVTYTASNERLYPIKTKSKMWSRYTEAFPQPWNIRVENSSRSEDEAFLTHLNTWNIRDGMTDQVETTIENTSTVGLTYSGDDLKAEVLFSRQLNSSSMISGAGLTAKAQAATLLLTDAGETTQWMLVAGTWLKKSGVTIFSSENPVSASAEFDSSAATALIRMDGRSGQTAIVLDQQPDQLLIAQPSKPQTARPLAFEWDSCSSSVVFTINEADSVVVWVDPVVDLTAPLAKGELEVIDTMGTYTLPLEAAWSERGDVVYFAEVTPREIGTYSVRSPSDSGAEDTVSIFIQDRWDPYGSSPRGQGNVSALIREGSWLYFSAAPGNDLRFTAKLEAPLVKGHIDNILFNGDFEVGIPNYPPRGWTTVFTRQESETWNYWTQEDAQTGQSSLLHSQDSADYNLVARPMRLLTGGDYYLKFYAKGDVEDAFVRVRGGHYRRVDVPINPSDEWRLYEAEVTLPAGYTTLVIDTPEGVKGRRLWVDAVEFGKIPNQ